jgi:magnesium transporter
VFLVLKTLWYVKESDTVKGGQVALFMGPDYVVTVRQGAGFGLERVRHDLEAHADVLKQRPAAVAYAVCDRVVDVYELVVSDLEGDVDEAADPDAAVRRGGDRGVSADAAPFFRDVADHLARVSDAVDSLDNLLASAFDANMSRIGVQQNDDMRRMSAWAGIFAVITVLAGIYGMNFANMPELRWSFGYPLLLLVMTGLSVVLYVKFKKSGWL